MAYGIQGQPARTTLTTPYGAINVAPIGPLITEDANTVLHTYVKNGSLVDTKGNLWTMSGTVPFNSRTGNIPESAGPFTSANYFQSGSGNDALDTTGSFTAVVVCKLTGTGGGSSFSDGGNNYAGWRLGGDYVSQSLIFGDALSVITTDDPNGSSNMMMLVMGGRNGTTGYIQMNNIPIKSAGGVSTNPGTSMQLVLGIWSERNPAYPWFGTIHEVYFTTTAPSSASFAAIYTEVKGKLGTAMP